MKLERKRGGFFVSIWMTEKHHTKLLSVPGIATLVCVNTLEIRSDRAIFWLGLEENSSACVPCLLQKLILSVLHAMIDDIRRLL